MSTINTNGLDVNYPVPGQNNSTQGFRNNFTNIKQNLNTAAAEITDLQNKVVLKSALANSTINNDMANTLIANASTLQFRSTMYNLGNALVDNVLVNCSLGDVQYGNLAGNILLDFGSWAPTNTLSTIKLQFGRPNTNANYTITFPSEALVDNNSGWTILENSGTSGNLATITFPHDVTQLNLTLTSTDCGNTIFVQPTNRSYKSTQIQTRTPPSTGQLGDLTGTVCVDPGVNQLVITSANTTPFLQTTGNTDQLYDGMPIVFTGTSPEANIVVGDTYYVSNVISNITFSISSTPGGSNVAIAANVSAGNALYANPVQYMYIAVDDFSANYNTNPVSITSTASPNLLVLTATTNVANNNPIMFTGTSANLANAGLESNTVYYVKNYWSGNSTITLSRTRNNGIAGPELQDINTVAANVGVDFVCYDGRDIFRRIPLNPF